MDDALENMKGDSKQQQQQQVQMQQQQQQQQSQQHQQEMAEDKTVDTEEQGDTASTETPPAAGQQKDPTERVKDGSKERLQDAATEHRVNVMRKRKATKGRTQISAPANVTRRRVALHTYNSAEDRIFINYICCDVNLKHLCVLIRKAPTTERCRKCV